MVQGSSENPENIITEQINQKQYMQPVDLECILQTNESQSVSEIIENNDCFLI